LAFVLLAFYHANCASTPTDGILNGTGWISDLQAFAQTACYNPTIAVTDEVVTASMDAANTIEQAMSSFGVSASISITYEIFTVTVMVSFIEKVQTTDNSLSLNYYVTAARTINQNYGYGLDLLNPTGLYIYQNNFDQFSLLCGDTLVSSYGVGAGLIVSAVMTFDSAYQSDNFTATVGFNIGPIVNISVSVPITSQEYGWSGTVEIAAFQIGGNPIDLTQVISPNSNVVSCSFTNMSACGQTFNALNDYASNFLEQMKASGGAWNPTGGYSLGNVVSDLGLTLPPSILNNQTIAAQNCIVSMITSYKSWASQLLPMLTTYPYPLNPALQTQLQDYYSALIANVEILTSGTADTYPTNTCFNIDPTLCVQMLESIQNALLPVYPQQINNMLGSLEYQYEVVCQYTVTLYPVGNGDYLYINPQPMSGNVTGFTSNGITITSTTMSGSYSLYYTEAGQYIPVTVELDMTSTDNGDVFQGSINVYINGAQTAACGGNPQSIVSSFNPYFSLVGPDINCTESYIQNYTQKAVQSEL
jgi:hypothetical protein